MADKVVIEAEVKSNIGDVKKDTTAAISEFEIMGVSLNKVKAGFVSIGKQAKVMFGSIKAGLLSTGIGAFIVAIGSLATYFTQTKKGAEILEKALAGVGAALRVIVDRISTFGGAIVKLFSGDAKGALEGVKATFKDIGTEIANDTKRAIELKKAFQELRDSQRDLNVETAQQRAEIERLKLIAEDVTKSTRERLAAAKEAFQIENDLLARRIANAQEDLRIQMESMELTKVDGDNSAAELDRKAELEINLADIKAESLTKQIELNNKINAITAEGAAIAAEALQAQKDAREELLQEDLEFYQNLSAVQKAQREKELEEDHQFYQNLSKMIKEASEKEIAEAKRVAAEKMAIKKAEEDFKLATINKTFGAASAAAGENVALSKGVAAAQTIYQTQQGIMAAMGATSVADKLLPYPIRLANAIATGVMGAAALSKIMSTNPSSVGGGDVGGVQGQIAAQPPAPQMMSGAFDLSGGMLPDPVKAFVVTDEMTNSQNQLANIRRRSTI
jgi:hypothetical protein